MALSPSLQQFKSSGVYRLEFDKSQITNIPSETIRLIIGFSKKGPFNTPVFVQDSVFFKSVFGEIDSVLERKGSYFHRTVLTCLDRGPVIVLNLLNLDDTLDTSNFQSVSTCATNNNALVDSAPVSSFFNKDKFWFTDPAALVQSAATDLPTNNASPATQRLLNYANVGRRPISVITRKSDTLGFDVIAKDWFGVGQVPFFMNENDYISDYLIDVIIVEGDFSNYTTLSIDPIFGPYFTNTGLRKVFTDQYGFVRDGLTEFLALPQVNVLGVYTGAMIPDFQDKNGNNIYIQDLVNLETSRTGVLMALNSAAYDDQPYNLGGVSRLISGDLIDTVGHTLESEQPGALNFLSYYGGIQEDLSYAKVSGATAVVFTLTVGATDGVVANALYSASSAIQGATGYTSNGATGFYDTITVYGPSAAATGSLVTGFATRALFTEFIDSLAVNKTFVQGSSKVTTGPASSVNYISINSKIYDDTNDILTLKVKLVVGDGVTGPTSTSNGFLFVGGTGTTAGGGTASLKIIRSNKWEFADTSASPKIVYAGQDSDVYQTNLSGIITDGDRINISATGSTAVYSYVQFDRFSTNDFTGATFTSAFASTTPTLSDKVNYVTVSAFENVDLVTGATSIGATGTFDFKTYTGDINESLLIDVARTGTANPTNVIWLNDTVTGPLGASGFTGQIAKGQYLVQNFGGTGTPSKLDLVPTPNDGKLHTGKSRLTRIISVVKISDPLSANYGYIKVTTNDPIYISPTNEVERYKDIRNFVQYYRFSALNGYTLRDAQVPNGSGDRQNAILDVMTDTNIAQGLTDREVITFRYIVDSFEGLIEPASKIRLTKLAKNRQSALAILNMPSVKQLKESTNPLFKMDSTTSFDTQYVSTGGNLASNPSNVFTLPGIADGANYGAFYGPNLVIRENGSNTSVPCAAHVSNLYIDKYNLALPYSIVAGPRRGVVTGVGLVGVEYAFDRVDLDWIEPFGYNAIVNKRGFGLTINANQTAQQTVKSALSQIHVRELLIYIQDGIEAILKNYRWEFNTAQNRLEIKTLADNFLSQILSDGGLYDFNNIMDSTNNTNEIIDNNIGILDTYIEPVRGMGVLVHRTTILRTGTIATGNYI
jgi:hypothetical protein